MLLTKNGLALWLSANVIGSAVFTHFASWTWLEPNLRWEDVARAGDAMIWGLTALPILAVAVVSNGIWFAFAEIERRRTQAVRPISSSIVVAVTWISFLAVDHLRGLGL